jgi:VWFA-related protein
MPYRCASRKLAALLVLAAPFAAGQAAAQEETFSETVDVNVVNVEVFVTDQDGRRATGLTRDDFEVYEDGKRVAITNFYAMVGAEPAAVPAGATLEAGAAPAAVPEEQSLQLAVYIDNHNFTPQARNRVLPDLEKFLTTQLRPEDRVLLATYKGPGSLAVRPLPAGRPDVIKKALAEVAGELGSGTSRRTDLDLLIRQIEQGADPSSGDLREREASLQDAPVLWEAILFYAQQTYDESRATAGALEQFVDALAGLPGRKALLYVSGGMPLRPAQALYDAWLAKYSVVNRDLGMVATQSEALEVDTTRVFEKLGARANANRVTLYALGATGMPSPASVNFGRSDVWTRGHEQVEASGQGQSLITLVAPTGGFGAADVVGGATMLARMREDFDSYYSLGYTPSHTRSGRNHKIEVRVKRPGLKARHRESYRDRTGAEIMADKTLAALMFGSRENPLAVGLQLGEEVPNGRGENTVPLTVKLPLSRLAMMPQGKFHEGRLSIYVAVRDAEGRSSTITEAKVPIRVPSEQFMATLSQLAGYRTKLNMRPIAHTVAVGVRDELGNVVSTVTVPYTPRRASGPAARKDGER